MQCPCGKELTGRQRQFCSITCRNRANGKKTGGWNAQHLTATCQVCGTVFPIPRHRLETARACSKQCLGRLQSYEREGRFGVGESNPMWKDGRSPYHYRRFLEDVCEQC